MTPPAFSTGKPAANDKYITIDALRIVCTFGVVVLHVYVAAGTPDSIRWLVNLRDFALPVMVMSSFFVLTLSMTRRSPPAFAGFLARRSKRLWLPMLAWTVIYSLTVSFLLPPVLDIPAGEMPSPAVYLTGYRHLWYLQFLFIGSLLLYPLLRLLGTGGENRVPWPRFAALAVCAGLLFGLTRRVNVWEVLPPDTDINVMIFAEQAMNCAPLLPLAVAMGLARATIDRCFRHGWVRVLSLAAVGVSAAVHLATENLPLSREAFAVAVFLAALQPIRWGGLGKLNPLASASYAIYVLHFLPVQIVWILAALKGYAFDGASVVVLSAGIYLGCFATARAARLLPLSGWLLPGVRTALKPEAPAPPPAATVLAAETAAISAGLSAVRRGADLTLRGNAVENR